MPFNGSSGSGDVTGEVVYANYGRSKTSIELAQQHIDLHGKIVIVRYGANFRGVKVYLAEQRGAAGVLIYSDPQDDGYYKGDAYPNGPWRPAVGRAARIGAVPVQISGRSETPGVASTPDLPDSAAHDRPRATNRTSSPSPSAITTPRPSLKTLRGPNVPQGWQGALPFRYHMEDQAA